MEPKQQPPYPLRMPAELREALEKEAALGKRSLNAEVVMRLELTLWRQIDEERTLQTKHRSASRQLFELEAQLMAVEEIRIARQARLDAQRAKNPSENNLAPLHAALAQAERVAGHLQELFDHALARYKETESRLDEVLTKRRGAEAEGQSA